MAIRFEISAGDRSQIGILPAGLNRGMRNFVRPEFVQKFRLR